MKDSPPKPSLGLERWGLYPRGSSFKASLRVGFRCLKISVIMATFTSSNEMSAIDLVKNQKSLRVLQNASGKYFFVAGGLKGYCSERAASLFSDASLPMMQRLAGLRYAEVCNNETGSVVPCLMVVGKPVNMVAEATVADLRL